MRIILLLATCILINGCYYGTYKPNMQAIPSIKKQGDWSGSITAQNIQLSYAHGNKWATIANGYSYKGKLLALSDEKSWDYKRESRLLELGLCHYVPQGDSTTAYFIGGAGWGFADFSYGRKVPPGSIGKTGGFSHFTKYFLQYFRSKKTTIILESCISFKVHLLRKMEGAKAIMLIVQFQLSTLVCMVTLAERRTNNTFLF
jgi:hypothetical protein